MSANQLSFMRKLFISSQRQHLKTLMSDGHSMLKLSRPEFLDICDEDQLKSLHKKLLKYQFDILFVNAGVSNNPQETIADLTTEEFIRGVMVTNALSHLAG